MRNLIALLALAACNPDPQVVTRTVTKTVTEIETNTMYVEDTATVRDETGDTAEPCTPVVWYLDADGDGYSSQLPRVTSCEQPGPKWGQAFPTTDCDDTNPYVNPAAQELCDAYQTDEDCSGLADDADPSTPDWSKLTLFNDSDGDGFGNVLTESLLCRSPDQFWIADSSDCNDNNPNVHPNAPLICDWITDNNCDGVNDGNDWDDGDGDLYSVCFPYHTQMDIDGDGYCQNGFDVSGDGNCTDPQDVLYPNDGTAPPEYVDCDVLDPYLYPGHGC